MRERTGKAKGFLIVISLLLSVIALVSVVVGLSDMQDKTKVSSSMYAIGTIDETGKILESKQSAYLKDMNTTEGLTIDIDEKTSTINYVVVFYDEKEDFISMTESLSSDFDTTNIPENATLFRVVITPYAVDGEAVELNFFNVGRYTSQLEIEFNK